VAVNRLGGGEQATGEQCGNRDQNSGARQILRAGKHRPSIVEQPHGSQETIHGAVEKIGVDAFRRCRGEKWRPRRSRRWRSGGRNLEDRIPSYISRDRVCFGTTRFQLEGKRERTWFGARVPTQPTESLADGGFAEPKPPGNPSITPFFGLEAEDGPVALGDFLGRRSPGGGSSWQSRQGTQSSRLQALLVATKSSGRVDEGASNIVLIRISRFEQRHHGVGFCNGIINRIVGKEHAADQNHSLLTLGLEGNAIVDQNGTGRGSRGGQQHWLLRIRMHGG
jgi:hypothetical protein